jgi:hypothetical protein
MSAPDPVYEGSSHPLGLEFLDEDGGAYTPASAAYEVLCMTTGTTVREAEAIPSPQAIMEIELTPSDNTLQDPDNNKRECRRVNVVGVNSQGKPHNQPFDYYIFRIKN